MRQKIYIVLLALLPLWVMAAERSAFQAAQLSAEFMSEQLAQAPQRGTMCTSSSLYLSHTRAKLYSDAPAFYVFNRGQKDGFVVVSADDRTEDVLMYSETGQLDVDNANPNLKFWLGRLQEEISAANDENAVDKSAAQQMSSEVEAIAPLLVNKDGKSITWYQESPYWNNCPMKNKSRCLTGCVATAAAQVMYKWCYPAKGTGSHSYTWNKQTLSKDFSSVVFDWENILPSYAGRIATVAQKAAVAELMYCCGVACEMEYGNSDDGGSGALTDMMAKGLEDYFGYTFDKFVSMYSKYAYGDAAVANNRCHWSATVADLTNYFNTDLEAGRPIIMGGEDNDGGHEFVCDGRDATGKFHINWGWEGESNCYCALSSLKPSGTTYNFSSNMDALIGLRPAVDDTVHVTGVSISPQIDTIKINEKLTLKAVFTPSNATVQQVAWSCDNLKVLAINTKGVVMGVGAGTAHVTVTTVDGEKAAQATIVVTNEVERIDTIYVTASEAKQIGQKQGKGMTSTQIYGVTGYVTSPNSTTYNGFYIDDTISTNNTFQGYECKMPVGVPTLKQGQHVCIYGYIYNSNGTRMQIKNGEVILLDEPSGIEQVVGDRWQLAGEKVMIDGQLYVLRNKRVYNAQGQLVR